MGSGFGHDVLLEGRELNQGKLPRTVRAMNWTGRQVSRVGFRPFSLDESSLLAVARKKTGLSDFGDQDFREGLRHLLRSLEG